MSFNLLLVIFIIFIYIILAFRYYYKSIISPLELLKSAILMITNFALILILYERACLPASYYLRLHTTILTISSLLVIIQLCGSFGGLNLVLPWQTANLQSSDIWRARPPGIFGEPAHMGEYAFFCLLYPRGFFYKIRNRLYLLILSLLMTFSIFCYIAALLIFLRLVMLTIINYNKTNILRLIFVLLMSLVILFGVSNVFQFERIAHVGGAQDQSTSERIYFGYLVFKNANFGDKLFGLGPGDIPQITQHLYNDAYQYQLIISRGFQSGLFIEMLSYGLIFFITYKLITLHFFGLKGFILLNLIQIGSGITINNPVLGVYALFIISFCRYDKMTSTNKSNKFTKKIDYAY